MARRRRSAGGPKTELILLVLLVAALVALGVLLRSQGGEGPSSRVPAAEVAQPAIWPDTIRARILNGAIPAEESIEGLARDVQQYLGSREEVDFLFPLEAGNASFRYDETVVVSRLQDRSAAYAVAALLSLDSSCVVWELPGDSTPPEVDVVVYLGTDVASRRTELVPYSTQGQ